MYRVYKKLIGLNFISIRQCPSHGKFWPVLKNSGPQVTLLKRSWGESQIYPNTISSEELPNTSTKGTKDVKHLIAISSSNMLNLIRKNSIIVIKSWVNWIHYIEFGTKWKTICPNISIIWSPYSLLGTSTKVTADVKGSIVVRLGYIGIHNKSKLHKILCFLAL